MIKSFECSNPRVETIMPSTPNKALVVTSINIDLVWSSKFDSVYLYFNDGTFLYPVFRISAKERSQFVCQTVNIEGWKGANLEIHVVGFGNTFVSIQYSEIINANSIEKTIGTNIQYRRYTAINKMKTFKEV